MSSKALIDKAGRVLAERQEPESYEELDELEKVFNDYRKGHLQPLTDTTSELQSWLSQFDSMYLIAQRLKRKPQILRKLNRFSVRLTQLQDIGGARIVVNKNTDVDKLHSFLEEKVRTQGGIKIHKATDYREKGRDDSGYRALHMILEKDKLKIELQVRSRIQHYWAELIERTSVIYGHYLKEMEGDKSVLEYFKFLSGLFFDIESGRFPDAQTKIFLADLRNQTEAIIQASDKKKIFDSFVNESIVKTLIEKEKRSGAPGINNWIIVFDWNQGTFVSWDVVERDADAANKKYVEYEANFPSDKGFEVVLVGSSDVKTIRETHSHYFGLEKHSTALEKLDESIVGFSSKMDIDVEARQILAYMHRKRYWGKKTITPDTLKNHYLQNLLTFDSSLEGLIQRGLLIRSNLNGGVSMDVKLKSKIEEYL